MSSLLPSSEYQYKLYFDSGFNNTLLKGINQGFSLYNQVDDLKLYRPIDGKPLSLDNVNFNEINKKLEENFSKNDDIYNNTKSLVKGTVDGIGKSLSNPFTETFEKIKNSFNIDGVKTYIGLFLLFIIFTKIK